MDKPKEPIVYQEAYELLTEAIYWNATKGKRMQAFEMLPQMLSEYVRINNREPYLSNPDFTRPHGPGPEYMDTLDEILWDLIISRILTFGVEPGTPATANYRHFRFTTWGKQVLSEEQPPPYNRRGFVNSINARLKLINEAFQLDPVANRYLEEALDTFGTGSFLASTVMLGVAAEALLVLLTDELEAWLPESESRRLSEKRGDYRTESLLKHLRGCIDNHKDELASAYKAAVLVLDKLIPLVKLERDECAHPKGITTDRELVYVNLIAFRRLTVELYSVIAALKLNK